MFRQTFLAGKEIFQEGESGSTAYIVENGLVEITSNKHGERIVLAELGPGEIFGEMALIDDDVRSAGASALQDTDVVVIDREQIINRLESTEPVIVLLIKILLARFRTTQRELLDKDGRIDRESIKEAAAKALSHEYSTAFEGLKQEQDLKRAIQEEELVPHFMPIYRLDGENGRHLAGFEALVRWIHPERGFVSPAEFVEMAETSGLIRSIDTAIMRRAWTALNSNLQSLPGRAGPPPFLSVNLSGRHFSDGAIVESVREFLETSGCDPQLIDLEVTESMLIKDPESALEILHRLKDLGVLIALDDFGTGYSSLSYLHRFPIDVLKIDQVFVRKMEESENSLKIVKTIAQMAKAMNLRVIAEGVETESAERTLRSLGCEYGQGFYYGKPLPEDDLPRILSEPAVVAA